MYDYKYETTSFPRSDLSHLTATTSDTGEITYKYIRDPEEIYEWYGEREQRHLCGGGLLIQKNTFEDNSAIIHASHGGAISIECDFINAQTEVRRGSVAPRVKTSEFYMFYINQGLFTNSRTATAF